VTDSLRSFEWHSGYEWTIPNLVDRLFEAEFLGRFRGQRGVLLCRSPWVCEDTQMIGTGYGCFVGVNHGILKWGNLLDVVVGSDLVFFRDCDPRLYPDVRFVTGFSQNKPRLLGDMGWPDNVFCHTSPAVLPCGHTAPTRDFPRPALGVPPLSSTIALWLMWYMGCPEVFIAGAHFAKRDGEIHGDYKAKPAEGRTEEDVQRNYDLLMPQMAQQFLATVERFRSLGLDVVWPGEARTRDVAAASSVAAPLEV
jgi:hypothetical protein